MTVTVTDMLGHEIEVGDHVVSYNNIYEVLALPNERGVRNNQGTIKMILMDKSKTTRPKQEHSSSVYLIPKGDLLIWMLKKEH
jgi:hypothetical protein